MTWAFFTTLRKGTLSGSETKKQEKDNKMGTKRKWWRSSKAKQLLFLLLCASLWHMWGSWTQKMIHRVPLLTQNISGQTIQWLNWLVIPTSPAATSNALCSHHHVSMSMHRPTQSITQLEWETVLEHISKYPLGTRATVRYPGDMFLFLTYTI